MITYLKRLTFLTPEQIMEIEAAHAEHPEQRLAQQALAREIISDLHGAEEFEKAVDISRKLFAGDFKSLSLEDVKAGMSNVPHVKLTPGALVDVLVGGKVCASKREAREFICNGAISLNGDVVKDPAFEVTPELAIGGEVLVIRRGKKKFYLGEF